MSSVKKSAIRVLIIDDSATMRGLMAHALQKDPGIEVVGYAGDAYGAREAIKTLNPDVVTLDIEMPRMDGLTFLEKLMRLRPLPVVVVTSKTESAEEIEVSALKLGAAHCLFKPAGAAGASLFDALPGKIREAVQQGAEEAPSDRDSSVGSEINPKKRIFLGASTGGVDALVSVLRSFPRNCPPTMIVQHMPKKFIPLFAQRLNTLCAPTVQIARGGTKIEPGRILIAPAGEHMRLSRRDPDICILEDRPPVNGFRPSVDVLFKSAAEVVGKHCVAALLTGMGRDGADGLLSIRMAGGVTLAQDEETSVVWGMPRVAYELGAVDRPLPLRKIAASLLDPCRTPALRDAS
ncbi:protein-glutamate methylesterase/protein-glutamine glutaminase [Parvularcula lutaonensis]|uniref:Protein-glutamate methylesterase/protein-glutamine glutaminase n=1 Tax=Parvularcula lutaonensis TaxID=491923 RepID=A0ABV7MB08_9PROT|nr:chemotaxis response regulator protein-glutamate methylesterase [Parvularcula lutaonensis]GGY39287.1 chemotaxis response regulator protein-glutamate methylesterase of group 1 operon [Parvularcula lutaonensis]